MKVQARPLADEASIADLTRLLPDYKHHPYVTAPASWGEVPSGGTTRSEALDIRSAAGHVTPLGMTLFT